MKETQKSGTSISICQRECYALNLSHHISSHLRDLTWLFKFENRPMQISSRCVSNAFCTMSNNYIRLFLLKRCARSAQLSSAGKWRCTTLRIDRFLPILQEVVLRRTHAYSNKMCFSYETVEKRWWLVRSMYVCKNEVCLRLKYFFCVGLQWDAPSYPTDELTCWSAKPVWGLFSSH